jgi:hypothetical protein
MLFEVFDACFGIEASLRHQYETNVICFFFLDLESCQYNFTGKREVKSESPA